MDKQYKIFAINCVYGIIQTTGTQLRISAGKRFNKQFGFLPDIIEVVQTDKLIDRDDADTSSNPNVWVGSLELRLTIGGETYSVYRDWLDEYMADRRHPNYNDDYFYDSDECYSQKRYNELIKNLNNE
jgi:hypothetical protein